MAGDAGGSEAVGSDAGVVEDRDAADPDVLELLADAGGERRVFRRCTFVEADLQSLDLSQAIFEQCVLTRANLHDTALDGVRIDGGTLAGADLTRTDLTDAVFTDVDLSSARLTAALLADTRFDGCRLIGADLTALRGLAVTLSFDRSNLGLANLQDAHLKGLRLTGVDLSDADLRGADLRGAVFVDCRLRGTDLSHTRLDAADLRGADLGQVSADTPRQLAGAVISPEQASEICVAMGLHVVP